MTMPHDSIDMEAQAEGPLRPPKAAIVIIGFLVIAAVVFVALSLRQSAPLTFYPVSVVDPQEVGEQLVGPSVFTVDGREVGDYAYFDFSSGSVVESPGPLGWDLAFQRFTILANGGPNFAGQGGILDLGITSLDSVTTVPTNGYEVNRSGSDVSNAATARWYEYSWTSNLLSPKPNVFAVRAADGRYAVFQILSYYCPAAQAGCTTIRYRYQGAGGTAFVPDG
tara:strand:+ start:170 stop:838 length:669 start_codon:yes stop_codon:yes gene_type:complete